jgi:hypothetical protein
VGQPLLLLHWQLQQAKAAPPTAVKHTNALYFSVTLLVCCCLQLWLNGLQRLARVRSQIVQKLAQPQHVDHGRCKDGDRGWRLVGGC